MEVKAPTKHVNLFDEDDGQPQTILEYLQTLEGPARSSLFSDPFTCLTIFRSLPPLAKLYAARLVALPPSVTLPLETVDTWCLPDSREVHLQAVQRLMQLSVLIVDQSSGSPVVALQPTFRGSLEKALSNQVGIRDLSSTSADAAPPSSDEIDHYAKQKWEDILHFIVGVKKNIDAAIKALMLNINLIQRGSDSASLKITSKGFQFLFQSTHTQVWTFIIGYMAGLEKRHMNRNEVLTFLFKLSFMKLGQGYSTASLTATQSMLIKDLCRLGLIWMKHSGSTEYYPTQLAVNLSSKPPSMEEQAQQGYIIVETTFRVFAYTGSPFQMALLSHFMKIEYKLRDMVVGTLTKKSVRRALKTGISAKEIINYLQVYAHPQMVASNPRKRSSVPENVCEQIELWEQESNRLDAQHGQLISGLSPETFAKTAQFCKELDSLLWQSEKKCMIVVKLEDWDDVKKFIKRNR